MKQRALCGPHVRFVAAPNLQGWLLNGSGERNDSAQGSRDLKLAFPYHDSKQRTPGRPRKPNALSELVLRLATENIGPGLHQGQRRAAKHEVRDRPHYSRGDLGRSGA
jgi:hypothetical protein